MLSRELINKEIEEIPDSLLDELYSYVMFLKKKTHQGSESMQTAFASEKSLAKDWNSPEDEEEWKDL